MAPRIGVEIAESLHLWVLVAYSGTLLGLALGCQVAAWVVAWTWGSSAAEVTEGAEESGARVAERRLAVAARTLQWFAISVFFTVVNKYFLKFWDGGGPERGFRFALTTTTVHLATKAVLSSVQVGARSPGCAMPALAPRVFYRFAVPTGVCTALDIALSNLSLLFVTVAFYTVVKSGTLAWTLVWALCLGLEAPRCKKFALVAAVVAGLVLATEGEHAEATFSLPGFLLVSAASCLGGLRWCLAQALQRNDDRVKADVVLLAAQITPAGIATLLPLSLFFEAGPLIDWGRRTPRHGILEAAAVALAGGLLAYVMLLVEIDLVRATSSLTLSVFGAVKEVTQISLAALTFGEHLSLPSIVGLTVVICASAIYALDRAPPTKPHSQGAAGGYTVVAATESALVREASAVFAATTDADDDRELELELTRL